MVGLVIEPGKRAVLPQLPQGPPHMVQSAVKDAHVCLGEAPEERRDALASVRRLCQAELKGVGEVVTYGMPVHQRDFRDRLREPEAVQLLLSDAQ